MLMLENFISHSVAMRVRAFGPRQNPFGLIDILSVQFDADEASCRFCCHQPNRSHAKERVEHEIGGSRRSQQAHGLTKFSGKDAM